MRARDPFGDALASLRRALQTGLAPGQHLPVNDVAAALKLSTSPVREALSRLCGEGLIEDRRGHGYFTRSIPLEDIHGLLALEQAHVRLALSETDAAGPEDADDRTVEAWIASLMEACVSQPLLESFERVHRRLEPLRRLHGPTSTPHGLPPHEILDAYYDRWRDAALGLGARLRKLAPGSLEYTTNTV